jgi:hypothetical protein
LALFLWLIQATNTNIHKLFRAQMAHHARQCLDWRCRFIAASGETITHQDIVTLMERACVAGLDVIKKDALHF